MRVPRKQTYKAGEESKLENYLKKVHNCKRNSDISAHETLLLPIDVYPQL